MFTNIRSHRSTSKSRRPFGQRCLRMESLEERTLMAGDTVNGPSIPTEPFPDDPTTAVVPASVVLDADGTLRVYGTNNDDVIQITEGTEVIAEPSINQTIEAPALYVTIEDGNGQVLLSETFVFPTLLMGINSIEVYAGKGNDFVENNTAFDSILFGGLGNDTLYGGLSDDEIHGEAGNDGLFGGAGGADYMVPGTGDNRILFVVDWNNYTWDFGSASTSTNTLVTLYNESAASIDYPNYSDPVTFQPGQWSLNEVKAIDQVLMFLHHELNNSKLLNDAGGNGLSIHRTGHQNPHESGITRIGVNDNGEIYLTSGSFELGPNWVTQNFLHEIAHNWEDENPQWEAFKQISGWTDVDPNSPNYSQSGEGDWWHLNSATFARAYGRDEPKEDFATAFAAYFMNAMSLPYQAGSADGNNPVGAAVIPEKIAFINNWINGIRTPHVIFASVDDFPTRQISKQLSSLSISVMRAGSVDDTLPGRLPTKSTLIQSIAPAVSNDQEDENQSLEKRSFDDEPSNSTSLDVVDRAFEELFGEDDANVESTLALPQLNTVAIR